MLSPLVSPSSPRTMSLNDMVAVLKAAGEPTRLRLLYILSLSDLTVSEITEIMGQSQPRISRHLRLLVEAGLAERYQEGAWAYFRATDRGAISDFLKNLMRQLNIDDSILHNDHEWLEAIRAKRAAKAEAYFAANAASWDRIRSLHIREDAVEARMLELVGEQRVDDMLDLGTGTGRMLELFAPIAGRSVGLDASKDMLSLARSHLDQAGLSNAQVRQGNIYQLPMARNSFDLVLVHQVLHFLDDPAAAIREVAKVMRPGARLLIVDFAPHEHDFLRNEHAHQRLGFSREQMSEWLEAAGLEVREVSDLKPDDNDPNKLTVSFWLAQDPRVLVAGSSQDASSKETIA
ncbi:MAG: metalloregulator ArsR/SmtB family transcription factor [Pseudomonadota bacterium]